MSAYWGSSISTRIHRRVSFTIYQPSLRHSPDGTFQTTNSSRNADYQDGRHHHKRVPALSGLQLTSFPLQECSESVPLCRDLL